MSMSELQTQTRRMRDLSRLSWMQKQRCTPQRQRCCWCLKDTQRSLARLTQGDSSTCRHSFQHQENTSKYVDSNSSRTCSVHGREHRVALSTCLDCSSVYPALHGPLQKLVVSPSSPHRPASQGPLQALVLRPGSLPYRPAGQAAVQSADVAPVVSPYRPIGHAVHAPAVALVAV